MELCRAGLCGQQARALRSRGHVARQERGAHAAHVEPMLWAHADAVEPMLWAMRGDNRQTG